MLIKYQPWTAVHALRDEMNRTFKATLPERDNWVPPVDLREETDRYVITADVPGVDPENIEVTMEKGVLSISGERVLPSRDSEENGYRRTECAAGSFARRFNLPESADEEQVSASGKHGVLEVVIPKKATLAPTRIKVAA